MDYFAAIRVFTRSAELGSFTKSAEESGMKVSTVSRYVAALESDLGVALFNRSTRRLHLTEAGQTFYERAAHILSEVEDARIVTSSLNARPRGVLRINIPSAFGRLHVMPLVKSFLELYPDISIDATLTDATVDIIETGTDLAVRIGALPDSSLIAKRLAPQRRLLVASPHYLSGRPPLTSPDDLRQHECLTLALQPTNAWHCRPKRAPKSDLLNIAIQGRLRANVSEALLDAVRDGFGVALLPSWLVGQDVRSGRLCAVLPQWEWHIASGSERAIWAVYPPKKIVPPKVRAFRDFLGTRFGNPPYWEIG